MQPVRIPSGAVEQDATATHGSFEGRVVSTLTFGGVPRANLAFEHGGVTHSVRADDDGRFRFQPPEPGRYALVLATAEGHRAFAPALGSSPVVLEARAGQRVRDIVLYLAAELSYATTVVDRDGKPVAGALVRVLEGSGPSRSNAVAGTSDARGELQVLGSDDALVEARHPEHAVGRARIDLVAQISRKLTVRLGAKPARPLDEVISGRVVDPDGLPVADALVSATPASGDGAGTASQLRPTLRATSDAEGRFLVDGLDAELYDVWASHEDHALARAQQVPSATIDLLLVLRHGGRIHGTARDAQTSSPIGVFTVVVSTRVGPLEREPLTQVTFFDPEGRWEVHGVPPGEHEVTLIAHGYAPSAEVAAAMPDPPRTLGPLDVRLSRGGRVHGTVVDERSRAPLQGARVALEGRLGAGEGGVPLLAATSTDASGAFELLGLGSGLRSLSISAAGHHARIVSGLAVAEGGDVGPIRVELAPTKPDEEPRVELTGIGAVLSGKGDVLVIGEVLPGGGAAQAGIVPGDAIIAVDGAGVVDIGFEGSIERIRGPEGTTVQLTVRRTDGATAVIDVRRTRVRK
jgi:hypothetical protein